MKTASSSKPKPSRVPTAITATVAATAASGLTILATTQTKPARTTSSTPSPPTLDGSGEGRGEGLKQDPGILPVSSSSLSPSPINWQLFMLVGYDSDGELVELILDHHPLAILDAWPTGPGDANHDGQVNLADLNLVLANMGTDYQLEETIP